METAEWAVLLLCTLSSILQVVHCSQPQQQRIPRPSHTEHARLARWLTHYNDWGTLSTQGVGGAPSSGVVSFADGYPSSSLSGRLFFYLTPIDETGKHIQDVPRCALSVTEAQMEPDGCGAVDPMEPTCARISILGDMVPVEAVDQGAVADTLFARHPAMKTWPADHGFILFELHIHEIHILDWYGGMHIVTADDYFAAQLQPKREAAVPARSALAGPAAAAVRASIMVQQAAGVSQQHKGHLQLARMWQPRRAGLHAGTAAA